MGLSLIYKSWLGIDGSATLFFTDKALGLLYSSSTSLIGNWGLNLSWLDEGNL